MRCHNIPHCQYDFMAEEPTTIQVETTTCFCCEEEFATEGIWFHTWDPTDGEINVCPDCMLDFIWDNFIIGASMETFLDLLVSEEKEARKRLWKHTKH